jgi:hypothetical protein
MKKENNQRTLKENQIIELERQTDTKLKQAFEGTNHTLINNESNRKFSEIFMSFIKPRFDLVRNDEEQVKRILNWGAFVWNMVVAEDFPEHAHSETIRILLPVFKATTIDKDLLNNFILRKKTGFGNSNFFIIHFETQFDKKGNISISVAVLQIEK